MTKWNNSIPFCHILFHSVIFYCILTYSIPLCIILLHSNIFYSIVSHYIRLQHILIPFWHILLHSVIFYSILLVTCHWSPCVFAFRVGLSVVSPCVLDSKCEWMEVMGEWFIVMGEWIQCMGEWL